jgi:hypothetical protein
MPQKAQMRVKARGSEMQGAFRMAPFGFSKEQWGIFERDGILIVPDALRPDEVSMYLNAAQECLRRYPKYSPQNTWKILDLVREHPVFRDLIDHERHVGYAYDIYGDQLRLAQADLFVRPRQGVINHWHVDGPRAVPYRAFSPELPLKLRIGYWLTDVPRPNMGNLVYLPGSHRGDYLEEHAGLGDLSGQKILCCRAGTMTIAHASIWHRVTGNDSDTTRVNLFLSYTPSWVTGYYSYPEEWLEGLTREQRIILRAYADEEDLTRPPAEDLPLFLDPTASRLETTGEESHKIRRLTRYERNFKRGC